MTDCALAETRLEAGMATTFDVLSWEMELAAARCIMLDATIGEMMKVIPLERQEAFVEAVHTVDLLSQQLTNLSAFARAMSANVTDDIPAPVATALHGLTLGALADRMAVALGGEEKGVNEREEAGDLDLF